MYADRRTLYQQIEAERGSKVLAYVTGDRPQLETQIHPEVLDYLPEHLDAFDLPNKISLVIYSRGGDTLAAWTLANMLRQFCDEFEVIVPMKAHSAATLISLGATNIVMSKQATLGPIDPSINSPLNPEIPGAPPNARLPVSVEEVAAYFRLFTDSLGVGGDEHKTAVYLKLADEVHPLALGKVFRARSQIQRLAERLLHGHMADEDRIARIVATLCSESGSHDYTINRREAREIGLDVETPTMEFYGIMKSLHDDIRNELQLGEAFDQDLLLAQAPPPPQGQPPQTHYTATRALIESIDGGSHRFLTQGILMAATVNTPAGPMPGVLNKKTSEGWRYEPAP